MMRLKKLASLVLALVLCLALCVPAMADTLELKNNPFNYVYETDPNWGGTAVSTISETQAKVQDTVKMFLCDALGNAVTSFDPEPITNFVISSAVSNCLQQIYAQAPYGRAGTYRIAAKYKYLYAVDVRTGERHEQHKWLMSECKLYQNGKLVNTYSTQTSIR